MIEDTIVAISTAVSAGAISIVRLSGKDAIKIADNLYKSKYGRKLYDVNSHTINYGKIIDIANDTVVDEVLVSVMKAPRTYTGEDIVEINCHGGALVTEKVLKLCLNEGARLSEQGEFTKRAFLNGKIDLTQAESVMDIIGAETDNALNMAQKNLSGSISSKVNSYRDSLISLIAGIEVSIDYPEYDDLDNDIETTLINGIDKLSSEIELLLANAKVGNIINNGINTVLVGRPNVGKSSLLNALLKEEKAIVTNIAGTTRDVVEGHVNIGGAHLNLFDTAGIRETTDVIEAIGIEKSKKALENADLVILLLNNNEQLTSEDLKLLEATKDKTRIILINKTDLSSKINKTFTNEHVIKLSLVENQDLNELFEMIKHLFNIAKLDLNNQTYLTNARQVSLLEKALLALNSARNELLSGLPTDLVNIDITNAYNFLGEIIGADAKEDLINTLFSRFCLGK